MIEIIDFAFDANGHFETPAMILCNPNRKNLAYIHQAQPPVFKPRLHGASEISFKIYDKYKDQSGKQVAVPYYDLIVKNRLIAVSTDFGAEEPKVDWYIIHEANETRDNPRIAYKQVLAYSYEKTLARNNADFLDGTYQFYNPTKPENTMMQKIVDEAPLWGIGYVDPSLYNRYRTFSDVNDTLYGFMLNDCEEAYDVLFTFDTDKRLINAYDATDYVKRSNVILTFDNVIKDINIDNDGEEVITALSVRGGGEVSIYDVNPVGDNCLYDFGYYKTTDWIGPELIAALDKWEAKVEGNRKKYSDLLTSLKKAKAELTTLEGQLVDLKNELAAIDGVRTAQYPNVLAATTKQYDAKKKEIVAKEKEIASKKTSIAGIDSQLNAIVNDCRLKNNFSAALLNELQAITQQAEYINENFIVTDIMDYAQKQEVAEQLYERGLSEIADRCVPQYTFTMNSLNFLFVERFASFGRELELGRSINVEIREDLWTYPILLELEIDYGNPTSFNMLFGTRLRMEKDSTRIAETLKESSITASKISSKASVWDIPVKTGLVDKVTEYLDNTLNAALHEITSNVNDQSVSIGSYGLRTMQMGTDGVARDKQLWIRNGMIAMTDDAWQSVKLAIGEVKGVYAVNAEVIAGKLLAGNTLTITNEKGTFTVDNKVELRDLDLELTSGSNKITLRPSEGLRLRKGSSTIVDMNMSTGAFTVNDMTLTLTKGSNKITLDAANGMRLLAGSTTKVNFNINNGNAYFDGEIQCAAGNIGGWTINSTQLRNDVGDYIRKDGYGKLGNLSWNPSSSTFTGKVFGEFVDWKAVNNNYNPIPSNAYGNGSILSGAYGTGSIPSGAYGGASIPTAAYSNGSITPAKLDRVYATQAYVDDLYVSKIFSHDESSIYMKADKNLSIRSGYAMLINSETSLSLTAKTQLSLTGGSVYANMLTIGQNKLVAKSVSVATPGGGSTTIKYFGYD